MYSAVTRRRPWQITFVSFINGIMALVAIINLISYLVPYRIGSFEAGRQLRMMQPGLFGLYELWGLFHLVATMGLLRAKTWAAWLAVILSIPYFPSPPIGTLLSIVTCMLLNSGAAKRFLEVVVFHQTVSRIDIKRI